MHGACGVIRYFAAMLPCRGGAGDVARCACAAVLSFAFAWLASCVEYLDRAERIILAGDIGRIHSTRNVSPLSYAEQAAAFLGSQVILVPGNHELLSRFL